MALRLTMIVPRQAVNLALEALTAVNMMLLAEAEARGVVLPSVYDPIAGVRYRREPRGREDWWNIPQLLRLGHGDCEDLSAAIAAERRFYDGEYARAVVVPTRRRGMLHAVVLREDGTIEDPSRLLGAGVAHRREP